MRKPVEPTVNIVPAIINPDSDGGEDVDQNPWDFWEPEWSYITKFFTFLEFATSCRASFIYKLLMGRKKVSLMS